MSRDMPERMSNKISQVECQNECQKRSKRICEIDCQNAYQIECRKYVQDRMPLYVSICFELPLKSETNYLTSSDPHHDISI